MSAILIQMGLTMGEKIWEVVNVKKKRNNKGPKIVP